MADMEPFIFGDKEIAPSSVARVDLPVGTIATNLPVTLSVRVINGARPGPVMFVTGAVHGDEITGVEVIRRLVPMIEPSQMAGTLLCLPIVNILGFVAQSRYLPDRRDLNRSFPGTENGSLAAQLAYTFRKHVLSISNFGIDLHSAAEHRYNLPQIRICPDRPHATAMAEAFGAPAIIVAPLREGSLRQAALERDIDVLLYEAGEAMRLDSGALDRGVGGVLRIMVALGMLPAETIDPPARPPVHSNRTFWVRAKRGGLFRQVSMPGQMVKKGRTIGWIADPFGAFDEPVIAPNDGLIIGVTRTPVINDGDALYHIAEPVEHPHHADEPPGRGADMGTPLLDEDEVI